MNWKEWCNWEERNYIAVILFIIAYIITIPWRNYDTFFDTTQGVTIWMHLTLIIGGIIVLIIGLEVIEAIVEKFVLNKSHKKN